MYRGPRCTHAIYIHIYNVCVNIYICIYIYRCACTCHQGKYTRYIRVACRRWLVHRSTCWKRLGQWTGGETREEGKGMERFYPSLFLLPRSRSRFSSSPLARISLALSLSVYLFLPRSLVSISLRFTPSSFVAKASNRCSRTFFRTFGKKTNVCSFSRYRVERSLDEKE